MKKLTPHSAYTHGYMAVIDDNRANHQTSLAAPQRGLDHYLKVAHLNVHFVTVKTKSSALSLLAPTDFRTAKESSESELRWFELLFSEQPPFHFVHHVSATAQMVPSRIIVRVTTPLPFQVLSTTLESPKRLGEGGRNVTRDFWTDAPQVIRAGRLGRHGLRKPLFI
jgi:hypothetical protein